MAGRNNKPTVGAKGNAIIRAVLAERNVAAEDFFSSCREQQLVEARVQVAQQLMAAGYALSSIAKAMKRHHSTILYYLPEFRAARSIAHHRIVRLMANDARAALEACVKAEGIPFDLLIAQWVAERALHEVSAKARAA
jgi:chromosomal replication initiation ATPase DnaA